MLVEAYKLVNSVFPFVKEAFLWRDGAEIGKPITAKNLFRRKVAVFVLLGSLSLNYLAAERVYKDHFLEKDLNAQILKFKLEGDALKTENAILKQTSASCVKPTDVLAVCDQQIETQIRLGTLRRPKRP